MFKRNKLYKAVVMSALITASALSTAQVSVTTNTQVVVSNTFTVELDQPLTFGTLAVIHNRDVDNSGSLNTVTSAGLATYTVGADGATNVAAAQTPVGDTRSSIIEIAPGQPAIYSVSGAARFTEIYVQIGNADNTAKTFPLTPDFLVDGALNVGLTATFSFTETLITGGSTAGTSVLGENLVEISAGQPREFLAPLRTDGDGNAAFAVGANLQASTAAATIASGNYSGSFPVTVNY